MISKWMYEDLDEPPQESQETGPDYGGPPEEDYHQKATRDELKHYGMDADIAQQLREGLIARRNEDPRLSETAVPSATLLKELADAHPSVLSHPDVVDLLLKKFGAPSTREASNHLSLAATALKFAADNQNRKNAIINKIDGQIEKMLEKAKRKSSGDKDELMAMWKTLDWKPSNNKVLNDKIRQPGRSVRVNRVERMITPRFSLGDCSFVPTPYGPCIDQNYRMMVEAGASVSLEERDAYIPVVEKSKKFSTPVPAGAICIIHTEGADEDPDGLLYTGHLYRCNISDYISADPTQWDNASLVRYRDFQLDNTHRRRQLATLLEANNITDDDAEKLRKNNLFYRRVPGTRYKYEDQRDLTKPLREVSPQLNHAPAGGVTQSQRVASGSTSNPSVHNANGVPKDTASASQSKQSQDAPQQHLDQEPGWSRNGVRQIDPTKSNKSSALHAAMTLEESMKASKELNKRQKEDQRDQRDRKKREQEQRRRERRDQEHQERQYRERARQDLDRGRDQAPEIRGRVGGYAKDQIYLDSEERRYNNGVDAHLRQYRDSVREYGESTIAPSRDSRRTKGTQHTGSTYNQTPRREDDVARNGRGANKRPRLG